MLRAEREGHEGRAREGRDDEGVITREQLEVLSRRVLDAAFAVHTELGPGLLESAYTACLAAELKRRGLHVATEVAVPLVYRGEKLANIGFRMDLLIESELVVEVKAQEAIAPVHHAQLVSYLKLSGKRLGLLLNFHTAHLKDGIYRRVNGLVATIGVGIYQRPVVPTIHRCKDFASHPSRARP